MHVASRRYTVAARRRAARAATHGQPYPECPCKDRVVGYRVSVSPMQSVDICSARPTSALLVHTDLI